MRGGGGGGWKDQKIIQNGGEGDEGCKKRKIELRVLRVGGPGYSELGGRGNNNSEFAGGMCILNIGEGEKVVKKKKKT